MPHQASTIPAPQAPCFADLSRDRLLQAAELIGMPTTAAERELDRMTADIRGEMDGIIREIEAQNAGTPDAAKAYHGGELQLLRSIRHVVIEDMVTQLLA